MDDEPAGQPDNHCATMLLREGPPGLPVRQPANTVCPPQLSTARERLAWEEFIVGVGPLSRIAYARAVRRFMSHLGTLGLSVASATPRHVAIYIESLAALPGFRQQQAPRPMAIRTQKQHLAAIRHFYHHLIQRHAAIINPANSVRSPRLVVERGETRAMDAGTVRRLLDSIDPTTLIGHRDRTIITLLSRTAARVGAITKLTRGSVRFHRDSGTTAGASLTLHEKNAKRRHLPLTPELRNTLEAWLMRTDPGNADDPMFFSIHPSRHVRRAMQSQDVLRMIRRRLVEAGVSSEGLSCHSFRAGAATSLLAAGVELTKVQDLLGHADPRTTRLYDARARQVQEDTLLRLAREMAA